MSLFFDSKYQTSKTNTISGTSVLMTVETKKTILIFVRHIKTSFRNENIE